MTGTDTIIGGWAQGPLPHPLPPTHPLSPGGTALHTDGVWLEGRQAGVPRAVPSVGCTIFAVVCDESLFRDKRHQPDRVPSSRTLRALHFSSKSSLRCLNDIFNIKGFILLKSIAYLNIR